MSPKPLLHRQVSTTFKTNPRNGMVGSLGRTFKSNYHGIKIGELFDKIAREMFEDRTPFAFRSQFSLVNITNTLTSMSIGYSTAPPPKAFGKNTGLLFTFAFTASPYKKNLPLEVSLTQNYDGHELMTYWSTQANKTTEYLTIGFDKYSIRALGLKINTDPEMVYLYNTIGILTKNFINNNNWYGTNGTHVDINTNAVDETSLKNKYLNKSFRSMLIDQPLNSWIYCLDFWLKAPNLLTDRFLDIDSFGLYYVMFLHDKVPENVSTIYQSLHSTPGGIKDYISKGIRDFNTALNNSLSDITDNCYAVVHLIEATLEPGGIGDDIDRDFARRRINYLSRVFSAHPELQSAFYGWFSDSNKAYSALMEGDEGFVMVMEKIL